MLTIKVVKSESPGGLEVRSVQRLARIAQVMTLKEGKPLHLFIAQGEDSMSGLYNVIADGIMAVSSFIFNNYLLVN